MPVRGIGVGVVRSCGEYDAELTQSVEYICLYVLVVRHTYMGVFFVVWCPHCGCMDVYHDVCGGYWTVDVGIIYECILMSVVCLNVF